MTQSRLLRVSRQKAGVIQMISVGEAQLSPRPVNPLEAANTKEDTRVSQTSRDKNLTGVCFTLHLGLFSVDFQ